MPNNIVYLLPPFIFLLFAFIVYNAFAPIEKYQPNFKGENFYAIISRDNLCVRLRLDKLKFKQVFIKDSKIIKTLDGKYEVDGYNVTINKIISINPGTFDEKFNKFGSSKFYLMKDWRGRFMIPTDKEDLFYVKYSEPQAICKADNE